MEIHDAVSWICTIPKLRAELKTYIPTVTWKTPTLARI